MIGQCPQRDAHKLQVAGSQGGAPRRCMSMATAYHEGGGGRCEDLACRFVEPKNDFNKTTHPVAVLPKYSKYLLLTVLIQYQNYLNNDFICLSRIL